MRKILISIIAMFYLFPPCYVHAQIIETTSFAEIGKAIKEADRDTLVIFDVKSVLILPQGQDTNSVDKYSLSEREKLYSKKLIQLKPVLVDPNILNIFADIKSKQIKAIALTSGYTGKFGYIEKREDLRIQKLKEVGISFKDSFPEIKPMIFKNIKKANPKHYPMFKEGIVFACRLPKGEVLHSFLAQAKFTPKKIIFVDNKLNNIKSVQEFCQNAKIDFHGFHYTFLDNVQVSINNHSDEGK